MSPNVRILMVTQKEVITISPKTGRPTDAPKKHETRIRMSDEDIKLLKICCEKTGMTQSEVIRAGIRAIYESVKE